ncbi:MAG: N-acetylglucosamine-6-phosphate deacetylase, partial [Acidimicrobiales bacterium]
MTPVTRPSTPSLGGAAPSTVVRAAAVVTGDGVVRDAEVVVEDGLVAAVRPTRGDVPDVVLGPGFVDLQVNGIGDLDVAVAAGGQWSAFDRALLSHGVTTWCPTLTSAPLADLEHSLARVREAAARPLQSRPEIAGAHLEGPFLAVAGAHRPEALRPTVDTAWLAGLGTGVAVVTLAPELPGALEAVARLSAAGTLVAVGHSACDADAALAAADAGARLVTHVGNAMPPLVARAPGLVGAALADPRLSVSLIADLVHTHPVFVRTAFAAKGP